MTTAAPHSTSSARDVDTRKNRQARISGAALIALSILVTTVFSFETAGNAVFRLSRPSDAWALPDLVVAAAPF